MTDRASRGAREALLDVVGHPLLSSEEDASVIEVSEWIDGYGDPSAGDFVAVLGALYGEIAVELSDGEEYLVLAEGFLVVRPDSEYAPVFPPVVPPEDVIERADSVRLLHRDDPELPLAVREAMEGEPG